ncbi:MAG TPA: hypothetical protein VFL79_09530 [Terriglobia bacterium]|nr:hypothetical protein [Terriglobia bacterium]
MTGASSIEERVIEMMLAGSNDERIKYLHDQMRSAAVVKRTFTGYGFFTDFSVPDMCAPIPGEPSSHLSNVLGASPNLQLPIGFVLFIKRGRLSQLEAHTYDEPWPSDLGEITLAYAPEGAGSAELG